jgi:DNA-binding NtrC family response regulator
MPAISDKSILVVDDEAKMCVLLKAALESEGYSVTTANSGTAALNAIQMQRFDVIITDLRMDGADGLAVLDAAKKRDASTEVMLMTAYASAQTAVEAMKKGAYDYVTKPFEMDELLLKVKNILKKNVLEKENAALRRELKERYSLSNMVGKSGVMQEVYKLVEKVAPSEATVLIRGESGTGKELIAQAIHQLSPRSSKPFVTINCAALPETLLESELFGYEKGAFTGADKRKAGLFEAAEDGTIFLDEIGEMATATQVKLLRAIQNRQVTHLGGTAPIAIHARTIAATNRDLEEMIKAGKFREDLYYRINVFPIHLPPLRKRREDIADLVPHFVKKFSGEDHAIEALAMEQLMLYSWPGNVRELENVIERSLIMAGPRAIDIEDLPPQFHVRQKLPTQFDIPEGGINLDDMEKKLIHRAIEKAGGNKSKAAKLLGITRRKLYSMLERFG